MAIAANKTPGIRAANISSEYEAQMSREHNDLNVLTMGARILTEEQAMAIVDVWLNTRFAGGRHQQRLEKRRELETQSRWQNFREAVAVVPRARGNRPKRRRRACLAMHR